MKRPRRRKYSPARYITKRAGTAVSECGKIWRDHQRQMQREFKKTGIVETTARLWLWSMNTGRLRAYK